MVRLISLLALLVVASGCVSSRLSGIAPTTLDGVNQALAGETAVLLLTDSTTVEARDVVVGRAWTLFASPTTADRDSVATDRVASVSAFARLGAADRAHRGAATGTLIGAAPGVVLTVGALGAVLTEETNGYGPLIAVIIVLGGAAVTLGGAAIGAATGAVAGSASTPAVPVVLYRAPLSRYPDG